MTQQKSLPAVGRWTYIALVFGAALGMFAGLTSYHAAGGLFARPVGAEFGWGRSLASMSYSASMMGLALGGPLIGMLMDRFGIRRVILVLGVTYGLAVMAMSQQNGSIAMWIGLSAIVGVSGTSVSVVGYLTVLPQWFDRRLGLSLALAMCGLGVGTMVVPQFVQYIISHYGWRAAYATLGAGSIPLTLIACALIRERIKVAPRNSRNSRGGAAAVDGMTLGEALRNYRLWAIWLIFLIGSTCTLALVPQLAAMFADHGFTASDAARGASTLGIGLLAGRLLTGLLLDRIHAAIVTIIFFVAGVAGLLLLRGTHDLNGLLLAAALVGLTIGAEGDLISYLVRSYFGLRAFGTLYGLAFSGYGLGAVIGPVTTGAWFDHYGSYDTPLLIMSGMLLGACALTLTLGRYRRAAPAPTGVESSLHGA
ncbi:MFS transporter [Cupriavidus sp. BIS7]|uniref:MFS transporter n=1 Tax=Cupriavidus sp. BIS7 TaxID=1217718 RepID=UPI0003040A67|nr:MFS transporter [Cupriavidus sp. BIS7]